ncbi:MULTISPECIES: iron-containing alcohol dehydrogenase [Clostridia]|uniref:iron-containing alcohol dehydrogenase n=1 Tax=Clostridia TaxID=186801 RepID=UPI000E50FB06|nr:MULTISPECIES: iron-containing alcohol dehydrogenase [Clostridia]RHV72181.1 iron-containing alcohol dehydrogenase [Roseburia sp. OM02-15]
MKELYFPGTFMIGSDILKKFPEYTSCYGKNYVFIGDTISLSVSQAALTESFVGTDYKYDFIESGKVCCESEVNRISEMECVRNADIVCGVGGGGCMDIARTIGNKFDKALVMIVTTASSDAPCTFMALTYTDDGSEIIYDTRFPKCPDLVVADSKIIANAPARLLAAGMGDAIATWYEGKTCRQNPNGIHIAEFATGMTELCKEIITADGLAAYRAVLTKSVTPQLENVIEANCFLSGIGGLNSGGCAAGHGIGDWLAGIPGGHSFTHGERVFIGLLIQTVLEEYPMEETICLIKFGRAVGLPCCIGDMGVEDVKAIAKQAGKELLNDHFMVNLCCDHSEDMVEGAINYVQYLCDHIDEY